METSSANRVSRWPWPAFACLAGAVMCVGWTIVATQVFARNPAVVGLAVTADLVLFVPAAYWWLVVRRGLAPLRTLIPVAVALILAARLILPAGQHGIANLVRYLMVPVEVGLVAYAVIAVRAMLRRPHAEGPHDVLDAMEQALERALGMRVPARLIAGECAALHYALRWGSSGRDSARTAFEVRRSLTVVVVLGVVLAIETTVMHLLVSRWSSIGAWVLTGLSAYTLLWVVGDFRAIGSCPTQAVGDALYVRVGLRCRARIPFAMIEWVDRADWRDSEGPASGRLNMSAPGCPNVLLVFRGPVRVRRVFGIETMARSIGLDAEDPDRFVSEVRSRLS